MKRLRIAIFILLLLIPATAGAQAAVDLSKLSAKGVAIYGWKNGVPTKLYREKDGYLFPIASITKLVTAKAVTALYPQSATFTLSKESMVGAFESDSLIVPTMVFSRDDMLRALLINSNNAVANQFVLSTPGTVFIDTVNNFIHAKGYTSTNFTNPSGLDPLDKKVPPNRMTPANVSYLLSDIYREDPFLSSILKEKTSVVINKVTGVQVPVKTTNKINRDPLYTDRIIISKTGITDLAGHTLAFVTSGEGKYDYVTVVFAQSKDRYTDGKLILDWLQQVLHYRG